MKIKEILIITLILSIALTTTACTKTTKISEPTEIHIQVDFPKINFPTHHLYLDAIKNFEKLDPKIKVIIDYNEKAMPEDPFSKLDRIKLLEGNESPDIIGLSLNELQRAEEKGLVLDLFQLQREIDIDKQILDMASINDKLLVLPYTTATKVVMYNKDMFDAAQIPYPQGDWTWEQFKGISQQLLPAGGSVLNYDYPTLDMLMASTRKGLLSSNGDTAVGYLDSPEAISTIQWLNAYYRDLKAKTASTGIMDLYEFYFFRTGMVVVDFGTRIWNEDDDDKVGVAPLPYFEGGKRANSMELIGFGISQKSKNPEAAWKFIEYLTLTSNEDSNKFVYGLTPSRSIAEAIGQSSDPLKSVAVDELNYAVRSSTYNNPFFYQAWNEDLTAQFQNLLTVDDKDIPTKLHYIAMKLDQEMIRLENAEDQPTESPSP